MKIESIFLFIFPLLFGFFGGIHSHSHGEFCGSAEKEVELLSTDVYGDLDLDPQQKRKRILTASRSPIRITADFSRLSNLTDTLIVSHIKKEVELAAFFYSKIIKVIPVPNNLKFPTQYTNCANEITVSSTDQTVGIPNSDFHFFINWVNDPTSWYSAFAGPCVLDALENRPIFGRIVFNMNHFSYAQGSNFAFQKNLELVIHEMSHAFFFGDQLYKIFKDPSTGQLYDQALYINSQVLNGYTTTFLKFPNIAQAAKDYYGCSTLDGMPVENQGIVGTIGIHWERTAIYYDINGPTISQNRGYYTVFDFALLKDSGWYDVDETFIEQQPEWGKGKGCDFIFQNCANKYSEFCYNDTPATDCDSQYQNYGYCASDDYSSGCTYQRWDYALQCQNEQYTYSDAYRPYYYNWDSRCFTNTLTDRPNYQYNSFGGCFQSKCSDDGTQIHINVKSSSAICSTNNDVLTVTGFTGTLTCPDDIAKFCRLQFSCPFFCSANGFCNNNKCFCLADYYGPGCQCYQQYYHIDGTCLDQCPDGYYSNDDRICKQKQCAINDNVYNCLSCSGSNCTQCADNYFLNNGVCKPCGSNCKVCTNNTTCTTCANTFNLYKDGLCYSPCPSNTYQSSTQCLDCHQNCNGCTGGSANTNCNSCASGKYQNAGACVDSCNSNQYINGSDCSDCPVGCLTCSSNTVCISCASTYFKQGTTCKTACDSGFYADSNRICQPCLSNCSTCVDSVTCSLCITNYKLYKTNQCLSSCPTNTYLDSNSPVCYDCHPNCNGCTNGSANTDCITCQTSKFLQINNACVDACDTTQFVVNVSGVNQCNDCPVGCLTCSSNTVCITCTSSYFKQGTSCKSACDSGFYADSNKICQPCLSNCSTCVDSVTCSLCQTNYNLYKTNQCLSSCPTNTYLDSNSPVCYDCHPNCNGCTNGSANTDCITCQTSKFLQINACVDACDTTQFVVNVSGVNQCNDCPTGCLTCTSSSNCPTCKPTFVKQGTLCPAQCDSGYYPDASKTCKNCLTNCLVCTDSVTCSSCKSLYYVYNNNQCVLQCPSNTYMVGQACFDCFSTCSGCTGSLSSNCVSCKQGKYLNGSQCVDSCNSGQYISGSTCANCGTNCTACTSSTACTNCKPAYFRQNGVCKNACDQGFYSDSNNVCNSCLDNCQTCSNGTSCTQCKPSFQLFNNNQCLSGCPNNYYSNGTTCLTCDPYCNGCNGAGKSNCIGCTSGKLMNSGTCVDSCSSNQYISGSTCTNCSTGCTACTSGTNCTSCTSSYYLQGGFCISVCNPGYYPNASKVCVPCLSNCQVCSDSVTCTTCTPPYYLYNNNQCLSSCPSNFFSNGTQCLACNVNCQECTGTLNTNCKACKSDKFISAGACVNSCNSNQFTFLTANGYQCTDCQLNCLACTSLTNCTNCGTLVSQGGVCQSQCNGGYYSDANKQCQMCGSNCNACTNATLCITCNTGYFYDNGSCVTACPSNYYVDGQVCRQCHANCDGCTLGNANTNCIKCKSTKYLNNGACVDQCDSNQYALQNSIGLTCQNCQNGCLACTGSSACTNCGTMINQSGTCKLQCDAGYYLGSQNICQSCFTYCKTCLNNTVCSECIQGFYLHLNGQVCVNTCPTGYFVSNLQCQLCHQNCNGCVGATNTQCNSCKQGTFIKDGACVNACGSNQFASLIANGQQKCVDCQQNCSSCTSLTSCTTCSTGYVNQGGSCQTACNVGYNSNNGLCTLCTANCNACTGSQINQCTECSTNYILYKNTCISLCNSNRYLSANSKECYDCDISCNGCTGPSSSECKSCAVQFSLINNACTLICPIGSYLQNSGTSCLPCGSNCNICQNNAICTQCRTGYKNQVGSCQQNCNIRYYSDLQNICQPCHQSCLTCIGTSNNQCLTCPTSSSFYQNQCLLSCPANTYSQNNQCLDCDPTCNGCSSGGNNNCTQCLPQYYQNGNLCVQSCNSNQFTGSSKICYNCSAFCLKCIDGSTCTACASGYVIQNGGCQTKCNDGYFQKDGGICSACALNCLSCLSESAQSCQSCSSGYYLYKNSCLQACPTGTYSSGGFCYDCDISCQTCSSNKDNCLTCNFSYYRNSNKCVLICNSNQYKDETLRSCVNCSVGCNSCMSSTSCQVCNNNYVNMNGICQTQCDSNYYEENNGQRICKPCPINCKTCMNNQNCTSCQNSTFLYQGQCLLSCPPGYYSNNGICIECDMSCLQCTAPGNSGCILCRTGYTKDSTNSCISLCNSQKFYNIITQRCENCVSNCSTCIDSQSCFKCLSGYMRQDLKCQSKCNDGFYPDINGICQVCSSECLTCDNSTSLSCLSCFSSRTLYNKQCISQCPSNTYQKVSTNNSSECISCNPACNQCQGEGNQNCVQCATGYKLVQSKCILISSIPTSCPQGYYVDPTIEDCSLCPSNCPYCTSLSDCDQISYKCHFTCSACLGSSFNQCISCVENRTLIQYSTNAQIGECTCPSDTTDVFEAACSKSTSAKKQQQMQVSTTVVASSATLITGTIAMKSPFFLQMADFSQSVGALSYVNKKNAMQFDQNSDTLRKLNVNYLIKSPFSENKQNSRILQQNLNINEQNKIEQLHGSSSFLVTCFVIFIVNCSMIVFAVVMRFIPSPKITEAKPSKLQDIQKYIQSYSQLMLPIVCLMFTVSEMSLCIFLQLYSYDSSYSDYKDSGLSLAIISFLYILVALCYQFYLAWNTTREQIDDDERLVFYFSLLRTNSYLAKCQHSFSILKKILYSFVFVIFYNFPIITVILMVLIELVFLVYLIIVKPFKELWINLVSALSSLGILVINFIFLIMTGFDSESSSTQTNCVLAIVIITNILLVLYTLFTIVVGIQTIRSMFFGNKTVATEKSINLQQIKATQLQKDNSQNQTANNSILMDEKQYMTSVKTKRTDLITLYNTDIQKQHMNQQQQRDQTIQTQIRTQYNNNDSTIHQQITENRQQTQQITQQYDQRVKKTGFAQKPKNKSLLQQQNFNTPQQYQMQAQLQPKMDKKMISKYIKSNEQQVEYVNVLNNSISYDLGSRYQ